MHVVNNAPLPIAIDDEYLLAGTGTCKQPDDIFSINWFCVENMELSKVLGDILSTLYRPANKRKFSARNSAADAMGREELNLIVSHDSSLDQFADSLPDEMHWDRRMKFGLDLNPIVHRQSNVLHAR